MSENVTLVEHPLVQHKLTLMRKPSTGTRLFRSLLQEIGTLLAYEATRELPLASEQIETPMGVTMQAPVLAEDQLVVVSILRAGNGLLDGVLRLAPGAAVGHIGLHRDPKTLVAVEYYFKMPEPLDGRMVLLVDPMLATGHSAVAAIGRIQQCRPGSIKFICLLAAPEGVAHLQSHHPEVPIVVAAIDERLDHQGYILPGLGDAGDRLFGTA